jgi:hypothetical protein
VKAAKTNATINTATANVIRARKNLAMPINDQSAVRFSLTQAAAQMLNRPPIEAALLLAIFENGGSLNDSGFRPAEFFAYRNWALVIFVGPFATSEHSGRLLRRECQLGHP